MKNRIISIIILLIIVYGGICPTLVSYSADGKIIIPNSVEEILAETYKNQNITEVIFEQPSSLKKIWWSAFVNNKIKSLEIPDSVEEIQDFAFNLNEITDLKLGKSVKKFGQYAFSQNKIKTLEIPDSVEEIRLFAFASNEITDLKLGNSVRVIKDAAFAYNQIKSLEIPDSIREIEGNAFQNNNLTELTIPSSVNRIGDQSFTNNQLKTVVILNPNLIIGEPNLDLERDAFTDNDKDLVIYGYLDSTAQEYAEKYNIQFKDLNRFEDEFDIDEFGNLTVKTTKTELEIPSSVGAISVVKIKKVYNILGQDIKKITFPNSVVEISEGAIKNIGLEEINFPSSLIQIDDNAFEGNKIESLNLAESLKVIGENSFADNNLTDVKIYNKTLQIGKNAFEKSDKLTIYGYGSSTAQTYANNNGIKFKVLSGQGFEWGEDNYNFTNSSDYFGYTNPGYGIGDELKSRLSNALYQELVGTTFRDEERNINWIWPGWENNNWGGSCAGISITSMLFKQKYFTHEFDWWQPNRNLGTPNTTYKIANPKNNSNIKYAINFYQNFQFHIQGSFNQINRGSESVNLAVNSIKDFYSNSENKDKLLYLSYMWENAGHAVLVTGGPEKIDEGFFESIYNSLNDEEKTFYNNNKSIFDSYIGGYRIPIYGTYENIEQKYIYIPSNYSNLGIRWRNLIDRKYSPTIKVYETKPDTLFNLEDFLKNDNKDLKIGGEFTKNMNDGTYIYGPITTEIKVTEETGENEEYADVVDGKIQNGSLEASVKVTDTEGDKPENTVMGIMLKDKEKYGVETKNASDMLNVAVQYEDSFMTVKTKAGAKAIFENKKMVSLTNPTGEESAINMTLNDEYSKLPWFNTTAVVSGAKEIILENVEEGILVSGDNLKQLVVTGNNKEETVELNIDTDKDKVLLKTNDDKTILFAYIDADGDGIFETIIAQSKVDNTEATQKLPNTGFKQILLVMIGMAIILAVLFGKKSLGDKI